jgi:hypothetical protein
VFCWWEVDVGVFCAFWMVGVGNCVEGVVLTLECAVAALGGDVFWVWSA